jgi:hypothetical protein
MDVARAVGLGSSAEGSSSAVFASIADATDGYLGRRRRQRSGAAPWAATRHRRRHLCLPNSLLFAFTMGVAAVAAGQTAAPPNAAAYFINLKDGETVTSPFKVQFG